MGGKILATEQLGGRVFVTTVVNALAVGESELVSRAKAGDQEPFSALRSPLIGSAMACRRDAP